MAHSLGDLHTRSMAADRFLRSSNRAYENPDVTLGRSSILLAVSLLVDAFRWEEPAEYPRLIGFR
jgi:hypothetical protein